MKISLYYDSNDHIISYTEGESFTNNFDAWLTTNGLDLVSLASYSDIKWIFYLDPKEIQDSNTQLLMMFNYKFKGATNWTRYEASILTTNEEGATITRKYLTEPNVALLSVKGGIFYDTSSSKDNCVKDIVFFKWIYNTFNPGDDILYDSCDIDISNKLIIP